jgi:hypothetical protein
MDAKKTKNLRLKFKKNGRLAVPYFLITQNDAFL